MMVLTLIRKYFEYQMDFGSNTTCQRFARLHLFIKGLLSYAIGPLLKVLHLWNQSSMWSKILFKFHRVCHKYPLMLQKYASSTFYFRILFKASFRVLTFKSKCVGLICLLWETLKSFKRLFSFYGYLRWQITLHFDYTSNTVFKS